MLMKTIQISTSAKDRTADFLAAYKAASGDDKVEIRSGRSNARTAAMVIELCGKLHGFTIDEARDVSAVAKALASRFPDEAKRWSALSTAILDAAIRITNSVH